MSGLLVHTPANVLQWLLINNNYGSNPDILPLGMWPIYQSNEPSAPDNCLTLYDTQGRDGGRTQFDGERQEHHGIQVRLRSSTPNNGYTKARSLAIALDSSLYDEVVTINGSAYVVHSFTRTSDVLPLGKETPTSKRSLFTINGLITVRLVH